MSSLFPGGGGGRGGFPFESHGEARRLVKGYKFRTLGLAKVVLEKMAIYLAVRVSFRAAHEETTNLSFFSEFWYLVGVKNCLSHAQIGLF